MRRLASLGIRVAFGVLACVAPCGAAVEPGEKVPPLEPAEFVNGDRWPRHAIERRVRLVSLFRTWSSACAKESAELDRLHERFAPLGLTVVSVTNESREAIEAFVERTGAKHLFVREKTDSAHAFGLVTGFPTVYLIDVDGRVRWRGNWAREARPQLPELLRNVVLRPRLPARFAEISRAVGKDQFARAAKLIREARANRSISESDRKSLAALVAWVDDVGKAALDEALIPWTEQRWYEAWLRLTALEELYDGFETATWARAKLRRLLSDRERLKAVKGGRTLADARRDIADEPPDRAIATLKRRLYPYRETPAWKEAQKLIELLAAKIDKDR